MQDVQDIALRDPAFLKLVEGTEIAALIENKEHDGNFKKLLNCVQLEFIIHVIRHLGVHCMHAPACVPKTHGISVPRSFTVYMPKDKQKNAPYDDVAAIGVLCRPQRTCIQYSP